MRFLILIFLLAFINPNDGHAQDKRRRLEKEKSQLRKDIKYKSKLLKETAKSKSSSLNELYLLRKKIANREAMIRNIHNEIGLLEEESEIVLDSIGFLEDKLLLLKEEYAQMIYYAYLNRSAYDRLMFVFAAEDFNQAYRRLRYLQQYSAFRIQQGAAIRSTSDSLNLKKSRLEVKKKEQEDLIVNLNSERKLLDGERGNQQKVFNALTSKEKDLKQEIRKKEDESRKLARAIRRIIEEEMRKQKEKEGGSAYQLTPEAKALSTKFESNRGKLPWPLQKGVITEEYGEHWHPILKQVKVKNNGINISTEAGEQARTIFDGEVTGVIVLPGSGKAIMVRHGQYLSVYSNLKEVFVQKGDKVETKEPIGSLLSDPTKGKTEIHFEVWKGQETMNPTSWLYNAN